MIKINLIILICCLFKLGISQEYETIVDTTKQWSVVNYSQNSEAPYENISAFTTGYRFRGDTIIDGFHYKFLEESKDSVFKNWYHSKFLCRDDSSGKVYIHDYKIEKILYDYTVETGDTIWIPNEADFSLPEEWVIVDSIKEEFFAGKDRKTIYWMGNTLSIIGFGNYRGPLGILSTFMVGDFSLEVLCFQQNDELLYQSHENCYINFDYTSTIEHKAMQTFSFYPNPANNLINIKSLDQLPIGTINIYTLEGTLIFNHNSRHYNETILLNTIKPGTYILEVSSNKGANITQKFIINK